MWQQRHPPSGPDERVAMGGEGDRPGGGMRANHLRVEPPPRRQSRELGNADPPTVAAVDGTMISAISRPHSLGAPVPGPARRPGDHAQSRSVPRPYSASVSALRK